MKFYNYIFLMFIILFTVTNLGFAKVYQVGPGKKYAAPSEVAGLLLDGDTVDIDAGEYVDCASWSANNILIRGIGGFAHLKDKSCGGKGIMVISGDNVTIENIEFSGATVPDANGAGIRAQGGSITVRHCYFHNNENGILASPNLNLSNANFLIEYSEFASNGAGGGGYAHNMYIGNFNSFTLQFSYTHDAIDGHEVKSRAMKNYILYNRITEEAGTSSRNIDLPNGGPAYIIGNIIEQGPNSSNSNIMGYGLEGLSSPAPHNLYIVNNTFVNDLERGSFIDPAASTDKLKVVNNIFEGKGTVITRVVTTLDSASNWIASDISSIKFVNPVSYDYHLTSSSPVIGKGSPAGFDGKYPLNPLAEYIHPLQEQVRINDGSIDIGAYEFGSVTEINLQSGDAKTLFNVYPNPLTELTTVAFSMNQNENVSIGIYDLFGRQISLYAASVDKGNHELKLNTSNLPSGIYFLHFITSTGDQITKVFK